MQQTTNLGLELYEATDNANLLDGYNASMRKIDVHEGTQDGLITLAQSTANSAMTAAGTADGKAESATSIANAASVAAAAADAKATTALEALGGDVIEFIDSSDWNTLFELAPNSRLNTSAAHDIHGVMITNGSRNETILIASIEFSILPISQSDAEAFLNIVKFRNYESASMTVTGTYNQWPMSNYSPNVIQALNLYTDGSSTTRDTLRTWFQGTLPSVGAEGVRCNGNIVALLKPKA